MTVYDADALSESARALRAAAGALAQRVDACTDVWNRAWDDRMAELGAELRAQAEMGGHSFSSATALSTTEVLIADRVHVSLSKAVAGTSVRVRDTQTGWRFDYSNWFVRPPVGLILTIVERQLQAPVAAVTRPQWESFLQELTHALVGLADSCEQPLDLAQRDGQKVFAVGPCRAVASSAGIAVYASGATLSASFPYLPDSEGLLAVVSTLCGNSGRSDQNTL